MTATVPLRQRLVNHLVEQGMIRSPWVRQAFADTPREVFVPRFRRRYPDHGMVDGADPGQVDVWIENVYTDQVLVVQVKPARDGATAPTSSSSEPTVMAGMLEALDLRPGHRVLEIGTGTGYNAALVCHRVGAANLTSIELDPALASAARDALASIGLHPRVHVDATRADSPYRDGEHWDRVVYDFRNPGHWAVAHAQGHHAFPQCGAKTDRGTGAGQADRRFDIGHAVGPVCPEIGSGTRRPTNPQPAPTVSTPAERPAAMSFVVSPRNGARVG
jgi:protein-L-isoaspartate O-methyltransferase